MADRTDRSELDHYIWYSSTFGSRNNIFELKFLEVTEKTESVLEDWRWTENVHMTVKELK